MHENVLDNEFSY